MMRAFHINLRRLCVVAVGAVFFVSGILKVIDPVGTSLIVGEYLKFLHLGFLAPLAKATGVALALAEAILGAAMLSGIWRQAMSYIILTMVGGYTLLTLLLVIFNPAMDCGCFGEALHLTHVQSFVKNLVLLALTLVAYVPLRTGERPRTTKFVLFAVVSAISLGLCLYSLRNIPIVDFTDYAPGTELLGKWDAGQDDASLAPALTFYDEYGESADALAVDGDVMVVSVYDPVKLGWKQWDKISTAVSDALCAGIQPLLLTTTLDAVPTDLVDYVYFADYKELITLNRSNGGYTLISDGLIIDKWPVRRVQSMEQLHNMEQRGLTESYVEHTVYGRIMLQALVLLAVAALLLG